MHAHLGAKEILPVIIAGDLTKSQEEAHLSVLRENRETIGWTMAVIKGISPTIIQHRIHLTQGAKPSRDPQCKLNPIMKEAIRKEQSKCFDNRIIYPISNNSWVSPVQVVLKKSGIV